MKAADCHKQNRSLFHAARCFEQVHLLHIVHFVIKNVENGRNEFLVLFFFMFDLRLY